MKTQCACIKHSLVDLFRFYPIGPKGQRIVQYSAQVLLLTVCTAEEMGKSEGHIQEGEEIKKYIYLHCSSKDQRAQASLSLLV